jgi:hypothetical protein
MSRKDATYYRDEELGAALRELETPEHGPGFYAELHRRLADERLASLDIIRRRRRARRIRVRWALRIAAVAVVAGIVLLAIGIPRTERTPRIAGPEIATAAAIKAKVRAALGTMRNLSGVLIDDGPVKGDAGRLRFTLTAEGDFLLGPIAEPRVTYDASAGVARFSAARSPGTGGNAPYTVQRGVAPGPPDAFFDLPLDEFGAFVRALLAAEDPRVREVVYEGRPAWRLDIEAVPNAFAPEFSGDHFEITVDRKTGVPVRVLETKSGAFLRELRLKDLVVNAELAPGTFHLKFPPGAWVVRSDGGFRRVRLRDAARIVGYAPLVPARVPAGYELAEVAVAKQSAPTGAEAANPPSRMVVSLSYRRGLDQFLVTTRLARVPAEGEPALPLEKLWGDPLATGEGFVDDGEQVTIRRGALRGQAAELVLVPRGIPHLWALTDELVVTVGGDLSRDELLRVTESLRRWG